VLRPFQEEDRCQHSTKTANPFSESMGNRKRAAPSVAPFYCWCFGAKRPYFSQIAPPDARDEVRPKTLREKAACQCFTFPHLGQRCKQRRAAMVIVDENVFRSWSYCNDSGKTIPE